MGTASAMDVPHPLSAAQPPLPPPVGPSAPKKPSSLASAVSGALSGSLISACVQPLDVIRTKMQGDAAQGIHRSTLGTMAAVVRAGGVRGLWQGTGPSVIRVGLGAGLHFVLLEQMKLLLATHEAAEGKPRLSAGGNALAGGLSRAVAAVVLCPITVVKTRMEYARTPTSTTPPAPSTPQPPVHRYRNTTHALWSIGRQEGVRGLFQGLVPTVLTNAPFSGLYYMFYSELKDRLCGEGRPATLVNFTSGCVAAVAATVLTQPTDVVRTRMQLGLSDTNSLAALVSVFKQGTSALMTGLGPRIVKRTLQTALVWTLYEELVPRVMTLSAWAQRQLLPAPPASGQEQQERASQGQTGNAAGAKPLLTTIMTPLLDKHDTPKK